MSVSVGVLITNYNSWELALKCAQANIDFCGQKLENVLLLDDFSSEPIPAQFPESPIFKFLRNERNCGFAASLNRGIRLLNTDIVLIFDADAYPLVDYFDVLIDKFKQDSKLAALVFHTVDENNNPTPSFTVVPGLDSLVLGQQIEAWWKRMFGNKDNLIYLMTCALAIRRTAFEEIGGFDEQLDWLDVDIDYSMMINKSIWNLNHEPQLVAFHKGGGTPILASKRVQNFYKNRWKLLRKHNIIKRPILIKRIILVRLYCEYLILQLAGKFLIGDPIRRNDKLEGRKRIIKYCRNYYC